MIRMKPVRCPTRKPLRDHAVRQSRAPVMNLAVVEVPPRELSIALVADERFGRVTGRIEAS
jgi:hypothetical protein